MKQYWHTSLRLGLCTLALVGSSMVVAQTAPAPASAPEAASAAQVPTQGKQPHKQHQNKHKTSNKKHQKSGDSGKKMHEKGTPMQSGQAQSMTEYERNALRRCDVFKGGEERSACEARVRSNAASGSVESGGILRQSTHTAPAAPKHHNQKKQHSQ